MKKLFLILSFLFAASQIYSQLLEENFNYPAGDSIGAHGWTYFSGVTNTILVSSPGLTYSGYSLSGIGNSVSLTTTGNDNYKNCSSSVDSIDGGTVYATFMVNVTSAQAQGDYFLALLPSNSTTFFEGRVNARFRNSSLEFGLTKASQPDTNTMQWVSGYNLNTTYLLVLKYKFVPGSNNDEVSLFIFTSGIQTTEPSPAIGPSSFSATSLDAANIGRIALRQGTASRAPNVKVDGIQVTTSWFTENQTVTVNPNSHGYSSLSTAFAAINSGTHGTGSAITVSLYGNTSETSSATLNGGIFSSCTIKPSGVRTVSGNFNDAIVVFDGADNVTIDGLNSGGNALTVTNTNTGLNQGCIRLSNGAQNNIIRNLTCNGVGSGSTIGGRTINIAQSTTAIGNNNNIIENNIINGGRRGIQTFGTTGLVTNDGTIIRNNTVKNTSVIGIFVGSETRNTTVENNESYFDVFFTIDLEFRAINIQGVGDIEIRKNKIYSLASSTATGFWGILAIPALLTAPGSNTTNVNIVNNMVSITDNNALAPYIYGVASLSGTAPYTANVYYNSVLISGATSNVSSFTCGIIADNNVSGSSANIKNNISLNKRSGGNASTQHVGSLLVPHSGSTISSDYNISIAEDTLKGYSGGWNNLLYNDMNYYREAACNPTINELHTVFWNSFQFVSNTNLHLVDSTVAGGFNGTPINGITTDLDGSVRNSTDPYRGAHELSEPFNLLHLTVAVQGATPPNENVITVRWIKNSAPYEQLALSSEVVNSSADFGTPITFKWGPAFFWLNVFYGCNYTFVMPPEGVPTWIPGRVIFCAEKDILEDSYDFTTSVSQAYGDNQIIYNGLAAMYNGDVNQDRVIDISDLSQIDNDALNFPIGNYLVNDITRDGIVDVSDLAIADNNAYNYVSEVSPIPTGPSIKDNMSKRNFKAKMSSIRNQNNFSKILYK